MKRHRRHPISLRSLVDSNGGHIAPDTERLILCSNEFLTAGAVWQRRFGQWFCYKTAPILHWMKGLSPTQAKFEALKRGMSWTWLKPGQKTGELDPSGATVGPTGSSASLDNPQSAHGTVSRTSTPALDPTEVRPETA